MSIQFKAIKEKVIDKNYSNGEVIATGLFYDGNEYRESKLGGLSGDDTDIEKALISRKEELFKKGTFISKKGVVYRGQLISSEDEIREVNKKALMTPDRMESLVGAVANLAVGKAVDAKFFHALQEVAEATEEAKQLLIANNLKDR